MWRQIKGVFLLVFFLFFVFNSFFFTPPTRNYTKREVEELNRIEREKKNAKNNTSINNMTECNNFNLCEFPSDDQGEKFYAEEEEINIQQNHTIVVSEQINNHDEIIESDGVDVKNVEVQEEYEYIYEYYYETIYEFEDEQNGKQIFEEDEKIISAADVSSQQNETKQIQSNNTQVEEEEFYYYYEEEINDKVVKENAFQEAETKQQDDDIQEIYQQGNYSNEQQQFLNATDEQKKIGENQKIKETTYQKENYESQDQTSEIFKQEQQTFDISSIRTNNFSQSQVYLYYFTNTCFNDYKYQIDDEQIKSNREENQNKEEITIILIFHSIILTLLLLITSLKTKQQTLQRPKIEQIETNQQLQELVQCMAQYIEQLDEQQKFIAQSQQKIALQLEFLEQ